MARAEQAAGPSVQASPIRRLLHSSAWSIVQNVVRTSVSLVSVPLTVGELGTERYGLWMLGLSVAALISFVDVGLSPLLMNRLAESYARKDASAAAKYLRAATVLSCGLIAVAGVGAVVVGNLDWPNLANIQDMVAARESRPLMATVVLVGALGIAFSPLENVLSARLDLVLPRVCGFVASVVSFGLLLLGLRLHVSLPVLAGLVGAPTTLYRLLLIPRVYRGIPWARLAPDWMEFRAVVRELLPSSLWFMLIVGATSVVGFLPNMLAARFLGLEAVSVLTISTRLVSLPLSAISSVLPNFWPAFTVAWHRGDFLIVRRMVLAACGITAGLLSLSCVVVALVGPWFVTLWTRGRVHVEPTLLVVLGCWALAQGLLNWFSTFLHSITDMRFEAISFLATAGTLAVTLRAVAPSGDMLQFAWMMCAASILAGVIPMGWRVHHWLSPTKIAQRARRGPDSR